MGGFAAGKWIGLAGVVLIATSFALGSTLARIAYDGGCNALTLIMVRTMAAAATLLVLLKLRGVSVTLPRRRRAAALLLGLPMAGYSYAMYKSLEMLPVALTVLIFYTYPLLTAAADWAMSRERASPRVGAALATAFAGLLLALNVWGDGSRLAPAGVALAACAAVGFAALLLLTGRLFPSGDSRPRTLHMLASAMAIYVTACLATGQVALPLTPSGWAALAGSAICYTAAVIGLFAAVAALGPVPVSLAMNAEPVASMILAAAVLGQHLAPVQILGAALVIGAIILSRAPPKRLPQGAARGVTVD